ncbi:MAG TPA: methyltransferase [Polyangiaceae bacterium]|nr:methyltransferase [Polyangiaceae bacterium]
MQDTDLDPRAAMQVAEYMSGAWKSRAIHAAASLGVADALEGGPLALAELAAQIGCHPPSLYRLLRALSTIGIFEERSPGEFATTALGRCLGSRAMRDSCLMLNADWHEAAWRQLVHSVRTGSPGFERAHGEPLFSWLDRHPDASDLFNRAMAAGRSYRDAGIADAYDFSTASVLVDVGGGHGTLLLSILRQQPRLRGVIADLPSVVAAAQTAIDVAGVRERCSVAGIDFFAAVPAGGDVYLLAHVIHDWDDAAARRILENCAAAMRPGGRVLLVENVLPADAAPSRTHWLDLEMLVLTSGGRERTEAEFRALVESAGLELVGVTPTAGSRALIETRKARP